MSTTGRIKRNNLLLRQLHIPLPDIIPQIIAHTVIQYILEQSHPMDHKIFHSIVDVVYIFVQGQRLDVRCRYIRYVTWTIVVCEFGAESVVVGPCGSVDHWGYVVYVVLMDEVCCEGRYEK